MDSAIKLESLNTAYVNLGALIRHLQQRSFVGRVKVTLDEYEADVFLYGSEEASVWETDHSTGRNAQSKEAMDRLLVRAQEPGGLITIYQAAEATDDVAQMRSFEAGTPFGRQTEEHLASSLISGNSDSTQAPFPEEVNWDALLSVSGGLIAAVERIVRDAGEDFAKSFRSARVEVGDDYPFMDPTTGGFHYADATVQLREFPTASVYVSGLTESLRRVVNKIASGKDGARFHDRLAVELAVAARERENAFAEFTPQLNRIAGTRVL